MSLLFWLLYMLEQCANSLVAYLMRRIAAKTISLTIANCKTSDCHDVVSKRLRTGSNGPMPNAGTTRTVS